MQERLAGYFALLLYAAGAVGLIWLCVRFVLPWTAPFIAAWIIAAVLELPVKALVRRGVPRSLAAGFFTLAAAALLLWGSTALVWKGITAATDFIRTVPALMESVTRRLTDIEAAVDARISTLPAETAGFLETAAAAVTEALSRLPALISAEAMRLLTRTAQASPDTLLVIVTTGVGTFFMSSAFPQVNAFLISQLPERLRQRLEGFGTELRGSFGGMLRAQLILMALTFFELLTAFLLLRIKRAAALAALTAIVDALPVFGTGIVLIPWGIFCLLLGNTGRGIGLLLCWAGVTLVRSFAQAKLMGDQIGLDPLASLMSIYAGWRVCGVWGMLLFPLLLVTLRQLNDRGIIRLWKSV